MRQATDIKNNLILDVKVTLLGNRKVGKTALMKKWVHNVFSLTKPTMGLDQEFKNLIVSPSFGVNLALFEIAGNQEPVIIKKTNSLSTGEHLQVVDFNVRFFKDTKIFFIVVSTENTEVERINQIKHYQDQIKIWQMLMKDGKKENENIKVILIENKFENGNYLTAEQLNEVGINKSDDYVALSVKNDSVSALENVIKSILPQLLTETPHCPPLAEIIKLDDKQADRVLNFVENMIRRGTTYDNKKPFKLGLFGLGGKTYEYKCNNAENDSQNQTAIMPDHVVSLLKNIDAGKSKKASKDILIDIYQQSLQIIEAGVSVARQASTQTFYASTLPEYILRSVQPATIQIHSKIDLLQNSTAREILQTVKRKLLEGVSKNPNNPYDVNFFGGDIYKHESKIIKLPQHVALIVTRIDHCLIKKDNEVAKQELSEIYQNIIQAQITPNDCRRETTQEFYEDVLPSLIVKLINTSQSAEAIPELSILLSP